MSFSGILILVLAAVIILALLFVFFHVFIALLPVALIAVVIIWLIYRFTGKENNANILDKENDYNKDWFSGFNNSNKSEPRKKARNVQVKDIDDKK